MLLGREWVHEVGVVSSTVHQKLFFWNEDGKLEMVEVDQSSYGIYTTFASEGDEAMARTSPFEIEDSFYVNNKSGDEKDKFFCWDVNRGFLPINKAVEKTTKVEEP